VVAKSENWENSRKAAPRPRAENRPALSEGGLLGPKRLLGGSELLDGRLWIAVERPFGRGRKRHTHQEVPVPGFLDVAPRPRAGTKNSADARLPGLGWAGRTRDREVDLLFSSFLFFFFFVRQIACRDGETTEGEGGVRAPAKVGESPRGLAGSRLN